MVALTKMRQEDPTWVVEKSKELRQTIVHGQGEFHLRTLKWRLENNEKIQIKFEEPKTKEMVKMLDAVKAEKKALIVMAEKDENVIKSAANIQGIRTALVGTMNVYEIINHTSFIVTEEAVKKIEEVYA